MLRASRLLADLKPGADRVFLDADGLPGEAGSSVPPGDAVVVAVPVTDALKVVADGRVGDPVDRDGVLRAVGFVLSRQVLAALGDGWVDPALLYPEVARYGFTWRVSVEGQPDPLRPLRAQ